MTANLSSIQAEQFTLAAALVPDQIDDVLSLATESLFAHDQNLTIFRALKSLYSQGKPVDIVTMIEALRGTDAVSYVSDLFAIGRAPNYRQYIDLLRDYELKRRLYGAGQELIERVQTEDARVVRESVVSRLSDDDSKDRGPMTFREIYVAHGGEIERRADNLGKLNGLPTGFEVIDYRLNGLKPQDFIVIAARPSMGKTTICVNIAEHNALKGEVVLIFSMEMSAASLMEKMISSVGGVPLKAIKNGSFLTDQEQTEGFKAATLRLRESGVVIDDRPGLSITEMRASAMKVKRKFGKLGLIVVDYIGLARGEGQNREQEVASVSRGLKGLAKELNIPVIGLSQLSRGVESRTDKRPIMSDLRESGAIEQDADLIAFLYRDEYYNESSRYKGVTEVIWRKFRNGEVGTDHLGWQGDKSRFVNLARGWTAPDPEPENVKPIRRGMTL